MENTKEQKLLEDVKESLCAALSSIDELGNQFQIPCESIEPGVHGHSIAKRLHV